MGTFHFEIFLILGSGTRTGRRALKLIPSLAATAVLLSLAPAHAATFYRSAGTFLAAAPAVLVETFEDTGQPIDEPLSSFTHNGITFTGQAGTPFANVYLLPGDAVGVFSSAITQPTGTTMLTANGDENFKVSFNTPYRAVGFDVYLNGLGVAEVQIYNGLTLLDTYDFPAAESDLTYLGMVSDTPITSFVFTSRHGATLNTGIDNLSVLATIPEPATLGMLGMACLTFRLTRRRR